MNVDRNMIMFMFAVLLSILWIRVLMWCTKRKLSFSMRITIVITYFVLPILLLICMFCVLQ